MLSIKMLMTSITLRKSLILILIVGSLNVFSEEMTLEQRMKRSLLSSETMGKDLRVLEGSLEKKVVKNTKEKEKIGKEYSSQIRLLAFENYEEGASVINSSMSSAHYRKGTRRLVLRKFDIFDSQSSFNYGKEFENVKVATILHMIDVGERFKVVGFLEPENSNDQYYVITDIKKKEYEVLASEFEEYFEIKPLIKDPARNLAGYLKITTPEALKKNNGVRAMYCVVVQDFKKPVKERRQDRVLIQNAEVDDPKFKEFEKTTREKSVAYFNSLRPTHKFTYDEPLLTITEYLDKKLCYGIYFKEKESFLTAYYFFPRLINGFWKF